MKPMKNRIFTTLALFLALLFSAGIQAENHKYSDSWGNQGFNLVQSRTTDVSVIFSVQEFSLNLMDINGESMHVLNMPQVYLPNEAGAPNLPGNGRYIAIPQGATPVLNIISVRTETFRNINLAPAPVIPLETEDNLIYEKDPVIYSTNAFYPAQPVMISEPASIRGVDVIMLGVTPYQYNPVTKELVVYRDIEVSISFEGGNGLFGEERLRSRFWDPILEDAILNHDALPEIDYSKRMLNGNRDDDECEYIIISPDGADFQQWADSLKTFRTNQGILTKVFTVSEVGGNTTTAIEAFINNAYNNWSEPPAACLLLGDYGTNGSINIISPIYDNYCASDNIYADVNGDHMPDVVFARITANNYDQLEVMVTKALDYERNPPVNQHYYDTPITACGWQTERWFQICAESVGGFWKNVLGKDVERINEIYSGTPGTTWSTAQNTQTVVDYFGPNGLGYIPATPNMLGGWSGGNATAINNTINAGSFMMMHRDHGMETGWGEPSYTNSNINSLDNEDLIWVFSINCLTGKYNWSNECFTEKFHRHTKNGHNAGALGVTAASETSYSFVNDTYVWGMIDNMWTNFMPDYGTTPASRDVRPAFGNAAGKYFLKQSTWPYNTGNKEVTYHLFHHHGDAFTQVYYNMPQNNVVQHDPSFAPGSTSIIVSALPGSLIGVTRNGELIGTATAALGQVVIPLSVTLQIGNEVLITVTKQNYFRYEALVPVEDVLMANFTADTTQTCQGGAIDFTDLTNGDATSWLWTFEGGEPATSTEQNPAGIVFSNPGAFDVTLEVSNQYSTDTKTIPDFINVFEIVEPSVDIEASITEICSGSEVMFTATCVNEGTSPVLHWFINGNQIAEDNDTIYLTTLANNDVVTCELMSSEPCATVNPVMSDEITITVHEYVDVDVSIETETTTVCQGHEITFTAIPVNPGTTPVYTWYINGYVVGDNSPEFTTTELADQDVVTCDLNSSEFCTNNNPAMSNQIVMTVNPSLVASVSITGNSEICEGDEVVFSATAVNPGTEPVYQWKVNGVETGDNSNTFTTTTLANGDEVTCELYSSLDCTMPYPAVSDNITMDVTSLPAQPVQPSGPAQVDAYLEPASTYTTEEVIGATAYTWSVDPANAVTNIDIAGNEATLTWDQSFTGTANVNVYCSNDCGNGTVSQNMSVTIENTFGISDNLNNIGIQIYPNPNNGNFNIYLSSNSPATINIRVLNTLGEVMFEKNNVNVNGEFRERLNLDNYAEGMYFLMIENNGKAIQKPIIIQK